MDSDAGGVVSGGVVAGGVVAGGSVVGVDSEAVVLVVDSVSGSQVQ